MKGVFLEFYMSEFQKIHGILAYDWLLELAKKQGISGGSVFRAIAGYGRHGLHHEHFFELASDVPVSIGFFIQKEQATAFIEKVKSEKIDLFYASTEVDYGVVGETFSKSL